MDSHHCASLLLFHFQQYPPKIERWTAHPPAQVEFACGTVRHTLVQLCNPAAQPDHARLTQPHDPAHTRGPVSLRSCSSPEVSRKAVPPFAHFEKRLVRKQFMIGSPCESLPVLGHDWPVLLHCYQSKHMSVVNL
ncbi:unnamed protein product [Nezara viridula]|uniref:Uncharacterized protein n=1 Tax=Nezara viridula TaxID=85310 RepID=A0A9P0MV23_NEZVI|nr:unnamed protein product [Nezara viridula]